MVLVVAAVLIVPLALFGTSLAEDVTSLIEIARQLLSEGPPAPPAWAAKLPIVGSRLHDRWQEMTGSGARLTEALMKYLKTLKAFLGGGKRKDLTLRFGFMTPRFVRLRTENPTLTGSRAGLVTNGRSSADHALTH